mgnify:CR=1 FL=1
MEIKVPNLGDGIDSATILNILVKTGDQIEKEETIMELETDKAVAPVPASAAGKVKEILVKIGDTVTSGKIVIKLEGNKKEENKPSKPSQNQIEIEKENITQLPERNVQVSQSIPIQNYEYQSNTGITVPTSPSIRNHAYRYGIDLNRIQGTGNGGRIVESDIKNYLAYLQSSVFEKSNNQPTISEPIKSEIESIDFSKWGDIKIEKLSGLRKKIAEKMAQSWQAPHVTQFGEIDITTLMEIRKKHKKAYESKKTNLTVTIIVIKALIEILKKFPTFNASIELNKNELILKNYFHIGVAVDTPAGLIVPVIKNVDQKSILEISKEVTQIAEKARDRKLSVEELKGGTFTVSNLGSLGVGAFTPIINSPEVAILGTGRAILKPVIINKKIESRLMMPIALSYDHRIIDGADGARFVAQLVDYIENLKESFIKMK